MPEQIREVVTLAGAERVRAIVKMGTGKLTVSGGAEALLEGMFDCPAPGWKPEVSYAVEDGVGELSVVQPKCRDAVPMDAEHTWNLSFSSQVPLTIALRQGSGDATIVLDGTRLAALKVAIASGRLVVNLAEAMDLDRISVKMGSGRMTLALDGDLPILADVDISHASGVSALMLGGVAPALENLQISSASGRVDLRITGVCAALETLAVRTASGIVDIDLAGRLPESLNSTIGCVSGQATVRFPSDLGVSVLYSSLTGSVQAPGFFWDCGRYINAAAHDAGANVLLSMSTVSGELVLEPRTL